MLASICIVTQVIITTWILNIYIEWDGRAYLEVYLGVVFRLVALKQVAQLCTCSSLGLLRELVIAYICDIHTILVNLNLLAEVVVTNMNTIEYELHGLAMRCPCVGLVGKIEGEVVTQHSAVEPVGKEHPTLMLGHAQNLSLAIELDSVRLLRHTLCSITAEAHATSVYCAVDVDGKFALNLVEVCLLRVWRLTFVTSDYDNGETGVLEAHDSLLVGAIAISYGVCYLGVEVVSRSAANLLHALNSNSSILVESSKVGYKAAKVVEVGDNTLPNTLGSVVGTSDVVSGFAVSVVFIAV